ncbi:ABC transporter substrate-binding protein [Macrococcus brunensis]|uniref:ABC transporter substrate-binding protein n=1 Tax=Macrococcus brunensis TaxID=198483 RepID=A0A4R6BE04_9STAP|nr:ABC transporter substrate-binding protein [Macrococcus brunensis]TDL97975.1 ABC transporter substrate-binding protein [Macrococcus brunensis]
MKKSVLIFSLFMLSGCQADQSGDRIVSLMPSNTEILYEMGLGDEVVGVSTNDDYPKDVKTKEQFDSFNLNKEQLLRAKPSVIVTHESARASQQKVLDSLKDKGIKIVYVKEAKKLDEIDDTVMQIAESVDHEKEGKELAERIDQDKKRVLKKYSHLPEKKVFIEVSSEPDIYTAGQHTIMDDMLSKLKMSNTFHDIEGWQPVALETVVRRKPDVMLSVTGAKAEDYRALVKKRPGLKNVKTHTLNDDWITRPGPRISKGLEELAKALED